MSTLPPKRPVRDLRIDFARGLSMFIIYIAHIPGNVWGLYIPAKFGPSDAAEIFVFCSGFASALAFGRVFERRGFLMGCLRVSHRCWQVYWAQIGMFLMVATVCILGTWYLGTANYLDKLNLTPFFEDPMQGVIGLLTVTYVPNYLDILPMYLVLLLMIPAVMFLRQFGVVTVFLAMFALWSLGKTVPLDLPAEWWSDRDWFFNPFLWQITFFTGFAFGAGWVKPPAPKRWLIITALAFVIILIPLSRYYNVPWIWAIRDFTWDWAWGKSEYGILRYLHLLAIAYLFICLMHGREYILEQRWAAPVVLVGQQALAVFMFSMVAAWTAGMLLDYTGRTAFTLTSTHVIGFSLLIAVAWISQLYKSQPWRKKKEPPVPKSEPALHGGIPVGAQAVPGE
jgi:hypothetical protein